MTAHNDHRQPTVLVIDNDEMLVQAVAIRLGQLGCRCVVAHSGAQGLSAFDHDEIDLVVTDLNMPDGNGVDLARHIRRGSDVPIIIITGFSQEYASRVSHIGRVTVIQKPFELEELLSLVELELSAKTPKEMEA